MKVEVIDTKNNDVVQTYTVRSDHMGINNKVDDSEINTIAEMIVRYCQHPHEEDETKYQVIITDDTLPNDPNTKEGRKKLFEGEEVG